jgi:FtsP/CotA-like multicopper oxidase with cupredoxin domain
VWRASIRLDIAPAIGEFPPMLSRRDLLIGAPSAASAAALATRLRAETADGFTVLRAEIGEARPDGPDQPARPIWRFGGAAPGPLLRVRRGDEVKVRLVNALSEPVAIHWHGVRIANAMDGAPPLTQAGTAPGASFDYRFVVPDAGTFWYHASLSAQKERGLYGALIVDELASPPIDRDEVLVFADGSPQADRIADGTGAGAGGTVGGPSRDFAINGKPSVDIPLHQNERLRLRFINASAQVMRARIDGHRLVIVALDGQPSEPFVARNSMVVLGPGNRADIFVDGVRDPGSVSPIMFETGGGEAQLARLVYDMASPLRSAPLPDVGPLAMPFSADASNRLAAGLATLPPLPERMNLYRALRVTLPIDAGGASAGTGDADVASRAPLFTAERGRTVVMALESRSMAHTMHLHGHHFRLLDRLDDG